MTMTAEIANSIVKSKNKVILVVSQPCCGTEYELHKAAEQNNICVKGVSLNMTDMTVPVTTHTSAAVGKRGVTLYSEIHSLTNDALEELIAGIQLCQLCGPIDTIIFTTTPDSEVLSTIHAISPDFYTAMNCYLV